MVSTALLEGNNQVKDGARASMGASTPARRTRTVWGSITAMVMALTLGFGSSRVEAEQTIVTIMPLMGGVGAIQVNSQIYVFAGPTATVSVDKSDRLTGAASAPMAVSTDSQKADVGLCYQKVVEIGRSTIVNFVGGVYSTPLFTTTRVTYSAAATAVVPDAGTYKVGLCVRNYGPNAINNTDYVNGWVQVTREVN